MMISFKIDPFIRFFSNILSLTEASSSAAVKPKDELDDAGKRVKDNEKAERAEAVEEFNRIQTKWNNRPWLGVNSDQPNSSQF